MFIAKNIFVYLLSMLALCLLIILFNYLGMNQTLNLIISSALFGIFITWYGFVAQRFEMQSAPN
ncbi:hypothetical protein BTG96_13160 [Acinetobacter baumannii]|nr:hypothetical protein BTG96_13160 [Acinetobacter baumannii]